MGSLKLNGNKIEHTQFKCTYKLMGVFPINITKIVISKRIFLKINVK